MEVADVKTKTKARCSLDSLCRPEVLIGLEILSAIARVMKPAAVELQRPDNDIVYGMERASRAMAHLSELRSEGKFSEVWEVAAASA